MKYVTLIESYYPGLTKSEKKVADYVLKQKDQILYQSLSDISANSKVGEATVLRFCYKLGLEGIQHLKFSISKEGDIFKDQTYENYIDNIEANMIKVIRDTKAVLDVEQLNQAIELMGQHKSVILFGVGASGSAALEAENRFLRIGKTTKTVIDSHYQLMHASLMTENDLVIAISLSGTTYETVEAVKLAKENKATVIALTNFIKSPLANMADCVLLTAGKENLIDGGSLVAKISQLYIIDLVCTGYGLKNKKKVLDAKEKTAQAVLKRTWSTLKDK
jgi:DNA-binding MurR/RpiR family transcriptional regulator